MILGIYATHHDIPASLLERLAIRSDQLPDRLRFLTRVDGVGECLILSTCNRVEVYLSVPDAERAPAAIGETVAMLRARAGLTAEEVAGAIVVETDDMAAGHLFAVACGLDSMVIGEDQIVAQLRQALRLAQAERAIGQELGHLVSTALRTSKRARTETAIGATRRSMVSVGLEMIDRRVGGLRDRPALLVGAGRMGLLAGSLLRAAGVGSIVVANRTEIHARQLAGVISGTTIGLSGLAGAAGRADVIVTSVGAGNLLTAEQVTAVMRERSGRPLAILDLALPRDVDPAVRDLPGVTVVDIEDIGACLRDDGVTEDVATVRAVVAAAVEEFRRSREQKHVGPVIGALRAAADQVVDAEVRRLHDRLPLLDRHARRETDAAMRRAVGKLLHKPTVRAKELATGPGGPIYVQMLTALFDLDGEAPRS
jgi:glutamyl-tRNA reductase